MLDRTWKVFIIFGIAIALSYAAHAQTQGTFSKTGSMANARDYHTATLLQNGNVLIAGGVNNSQYLIQIQSST